VQEAHTRLLDYRRASSVPCSLTTESFHGADSLRNIAEVLIYQTNLVPFFRDVESRDSVRGPARVPYACQLITGTAFLAGLAVNVLRKLLILCGPVFFESHLVHQFSQPSFFLPA
jgi:hypothetical protein